jgi:predicted AlkP superfamily phosphohydrolase/phosphomutase
MHANIIMIIIGVDAASHNVIEPNLDKLPNISGLIREGSYRRIKLKEKPLSISVWCSIFSGKMPDEHKHTDFMKDAVMKKRNEMDMDFVWDILCSNGIDVRAMQIPIFFPPYNFRCEFVPLKNGLSPDISDLEEDFERITDDSCRMLERKPDLFIVVYTMLDRLSHFHWGEPLILEWYRKIDSAIGRLAAYDNKVLIVSDHGFCSWKESKTNTLKRFTPSGREVKGDHSDISIVIERGVDFGITKPQDVFFAIMKEFGV